ncbi:MAG: polymorphic toxin-type HINT domain-containing protein [Arachnia propionica]|uniref:polymorphic toxin-type HINT domain-containing protein n=1 Tax=Arachnia propionica TaxID=1750 RepID=UPI0027067B00|nr:polymorphic toxin-type HINT domain-containing protein [Arachnia propionica]
MTDFSGYYSSLFKANGVTQLGDLDEIVRNLQLVASKVADLDEKARAENNRRRQAREWAERRANRGDFQKAWEGFWNCGEEPPFSEIDENSTGPNESVTPPVPAQRSPLEGRGPTSVSSGVPSNLRSFSSNTRTADELLASTPGNLRTHCESFAASCSWATLDASSVISGFEAWLSSNGSEATWADVVAQAFEDAGGGDGPATVSDATLDAVLAAAGVGAERTDIQIDPPTAYGSPPTTGYSNDPVNTASGGFLETEEDLPFTGLASPLGVVRAYSSLNPAVGAFGPGWSWWSEAGLSVADDSARLTLFDGRVIVFPRRGEGWDRATGENLWLENTPDGGFLVTSSWGMRWVLDAAGRVRVTSSDPGTEVAFSYDEHGHLVGLRHEFGRSLEVRWDAAGERVVAVVASDGRAVDYHYDDAGRLVEVDAPGRRRRYRWDDASRIVEVIDADGVVEVVNTFDEHGRVVAQLSPHGRRTRFAYFAGGITQTSDEDGARANTWIHDRKGRLIGVVDADGRRQSTGYDQWGNPVLVRQRDGAMTVSTYDARGRLEVRQLPSGAREQRQWDDLDRLTCVTVRAGDDSPEAVTRYEYRGAERSPWRVVDPEGGVTEMVWERGLLKRIVDPTGVGVDFGYDEFGELVSSTDAMGATAVLERDEVGRVVAAVTPLGNRTVFRYDPDSGVLVSRTDPTGARWTFEHTGAGRLCAVIDPEGARTEISHDESGETVETVDPLGRKVRRSYDDLGNLASVELPDGSSWEFGYDAVSRLVSFTDPAGGVRGLSYGADGLLAGTVDPTGVQRGVVRDVMGAPTQVIDGGDNLSARFDRLGRVVAVAGADGQEVLNRYDLCGRLVEQVTSDGAVTRIERDAAGRVVAVTQPMGGTYRYEYDACGRWVATISTGGDRYELILDADSRVVGEVWPDGEQVTTRFDAAGRIVERRQPGRGVVRFRYDRCGRIVSVRDPWNGHRRFRYDPAGQLVEAIDALGGVTRFGYDELAHQVEVIDPAGGVTRRTFDPLGRITSETDPLGRTTTWMRDAAGRVVRSVRPSGRVMSWEWNEHGRLARTLVDGQLLSELERDFASRTMTITEGTGSRVEMAWDTRGNLLRRLRDGVGMAWTYDRGGRRSSMCRPDGSVTTYDYDSNNRLAAITHPDVGRIEITRDAIGRITRVHGDGLDATWTWQGGAVVSNRVNRRGFIQELRLERNDDDQVVAQVQDGLRTEFSYDKAGRLTGTLSSEGLVSSYEWDAGGRLTAQSVGEARTTFRYDQAGQLVAATGPSGQVTRYTYDPDGQRIREIGPESERMFAWDPRGFLASITSVVRDGDSVQVTSRRDLDTDATGHLARIDGTDVFWDSAAGAPSLAQIGSQVVVDALAATTLATRDGGGEGAWLVPDVDGARVDAWLIPSLDIPHVAQPAAGDDLASGDVAGGMVGVGAWGALNLDGLSLTGVRAYDPATRAFLSPDPLPAVTASGWAGNPYSWAGNNPVGATDPLGLRPVSEDDLRVYQQASNGWLANSVAAAGSWVKDNWEYIAAGAVIVAGVAVMCTGVGGPIGAAMIGGALMGAGSSIASQKFTTGSVDWGKVAVDGAIGAVSGLAGGGAAAAIGRAAQGASCLGRNIITGAAESAVDGAVSGGLSYLTGPGPHTVAGFAAAAGTGGLEGGVMGGAGGALSKLTGVARYGCFTPDTHVLMADGSTKPITEVQVGDRVVSHDPISGNNVEGTVEQLHVHEDVPTLKLTTTAGEITTTATHPFYVEDKGWLPAGELREGDHLRPADGSTSTVEVLTLQATGHTQTVHNLTITGWKNYHVLTKDNVESIPVLVHNDGPCDDPVKAVQEAARDAAARGRQDLLGTLTPAQQRAVTEKPGLSTPFTGHAVHNQTKVALADKYGEGVFEYNPSHGPDFTYTPTGEKIELTTPKQVDAHKARPNPEYQDCGYATYDLPDWGT